MLGSPIPYLKGMRILMFQLSGFCFRGLHAEALQVEFSELGSPFKPPLYYGSLIKRTLKSDPNVETMTNCSHLTITLLSRGQEYPKP